MVETDRMKLLLQVARAKRCSSAPMSCSKCGSQSLSACEEGWQCVNCGKVHYLTRVTRNH